MWRSGALYEVKSRHFFRRLSIPRHQRHFVVPLFLSLLFFFIVCVFLVVNQTAAAEVRAGDVAGAAAHFTAVLPPSNEGRSILYHRRLESSPGRTKSIGKARKSSTAGEFAGLCLLALSSITSGFLRDRDVRLSGSCSCLPAEYSRAAAP